jgi:transposase
VIVDIDEMGPESAKSHPGKHLVPGVADGPHGPHEVRATQEIDYGRRGKGYVFGALREASGEVLTACYPGRTSASFVDFLSKVDAWLEPEVERVDAIMDNLSTHRTPDVLLFSALHPRWEFVFQPKYAAYLNLIESWWKILRSLALKGRRFATWDEIVEAIIAATAYWNAHRHPFGWGGRRRRRIARRPGVAALPLAA